MQSNLLVDKDGLVHGPHILKYKLHKQWFLPFVLSQTTQGLTRLPPRESTLDDRWTRKPFGLSRVQPIYLNVPRLSSLFLKILTLLAPTQSADKLFHSFAVLCENENVLISSLHCFFANVTPYPLVLLFLNREKKFRQHFPTHSTF